MNIAEIEIDLLELTEKPFNKLEFIYEFLEIYNAPKATLTKLKQGIGNHVHIPGGLIQTGDLLWKNKIYFHTSDKEEPGLVVEKLIADPLVKRHRPRFIVSTNGKELSFRDLKTDQHIDTKYKNLNEYFLFFLPLANIERYEAPVENPADIKATGRIAKLYDSILEANKDWIDRDYTHDFNQFMTRLLFCFFAEDTSIFEKNIFTSTIMNLSKEDGSNTHEILNNIFLAMDQKSANRQNLPEYCRKFEYVNGGLFSDKTLVPKFSKKSLRLFKECGELFWKDINPDILGSMIQAVAQPLLREDMGMHYTSIPNIMKVLQPLFLTSLEDDFKEAANNENKLQRILQRIYNIRVLDPACGSGNFLIIAYKELRRLEMRIFEKLKDVSKQWLLPMTEVKLTQFFGIELTDFATETAKLSLWIAEYQMNEVFKITFGKAPSPLPLRDSGNIIRENAANYDWAKICPVDTKKETYIVGNPPYLGRASQTKSQKADMAKVFSHVTKKYKNLDYVALWYMKAAEYCQKASAQCALVTTNSICQGEQVSMLWPIIYKYELEIGFAHQSFKWRNSAAKNAAVTCIIVGIRPLSKKEKIIYNEKYHQVVKNISPYLIAGENFFVTKRKKPLSFEREMNFGSMANDGGHLLLSPEEKTSIIDSYPQANKFIRRLYGSREFSTGTERYCLWIEDSDVDDALQIAPIKERAELVRKLRSKSKRDATSELAKYAYRFGEVRYKKSEAILVPKSTSERRKYITAGYIQPGSIITDGAFAIYDAEPYIFALISSRLHYVWGASIGGRFKMDPRYSNTLVYNTFPTPSLSVDQKQTLEELAIEILGARELNPGKTISWLYDPDHMPSNLLEAHKNLDDTLEQLYIGRPFDTDGERLEHLLKLYAHKSTKIISNQKVK